MPNVVMESVPAYLSIMEIPTLVVAQNVFKTQNVHEIELVLTTNVPIPVLEFVVKMQNVLSLITSSLVAAYQIMKAIHLLLAKL